MGKTPVKGWVVSDVVMAIGLVDKNKGCSDLDPLNVPGHLDNKQ